MRIAGIILVVLFGLVPIFLPMAVHPQAAGAMLLHGGVGVTLLMLGIVFGSIYLMKRTIKSRTAAFGEDGNARAKLVSLDVLAKWSYGFVIVTGLGIAFFLAQGAMKLTRIEHHGARATADVLDIYTGTCGKHGCTVEVQYSFKPEGRNAAQTGFAYLANSEHPDDPNWVYAQTHHHVPIAYDISDPNVSALNFNDMVLKVDHMKSTVVGIEMIAVGWTLLLAFMWLIFRNARGKQMREAGFA